MPETSIIDAREMFKHVFGGEAFVDIIGELSFAQMLQDAFEAAQEDETAIDNRAAPRDTSSRNHYHGTTGTDARQRAQRVGHLSCKLLDKLALYTEGHYTAGEFTEYCVKEASNLRQESFGPELLKSVGYVYSMRAKQYLGREQLLGAQLGVPFDQGEGTHCLPGLFHDFRRPRNVQRRPEAAARTRC